MSQLNQFNSLILRICVIHKLTYAKCYRLAHLQEIYDQFNNLGVKFSLNELTQIIYAQLRNKGDLPGENQSIRTMFIDKLLENPEYAPLVALSISKAKKVDMIEAPDLSDILHYITNNQPSDVNTAHAIDVTYLELVNEVVRKKATADQNINNLHTYYTQNDRGVEIVNKLMNFATHCQTLSDYLGNNAFGSKIYDKKSFNIPGLIPIKRSLSKSEQYHIKTEEGTGLVTEEIINFRVDVGFVRRQEAMYTN